MATLNARTRVNASPERTFQVFTDFRNMAQHLSGVSRIEVISDGPVSSGTRWKETRVMFKKEATEEMEITSFDPPGSYSVGSNACGCKWDFTFTFTPDGDGTEVVLTGGAQATSLFSKIMMIITSPMMRVMRNACLKDMEELAVVAESSA